MGVSFEWSDLGATCVVFAQRLKDIKGITFVLCGDLNITACKDPRVRVGVGADRCRLSKIINPNSTALRKAAL